MFQFIHVVFLFYDSLILYNHYFGLFISILLTDTCKQFNKFIRKFYYFSYGKTAYLTKERICDDVIYFGEGKIQNLHVVKEIMHKSFNIISIWENNGY